MLSFKTLLPHLHSSAEMPAKQKKASSI